MKKDILADIMSPKNSIYRFRTTEVKHLIKARGGVEAVAVALKTTARTLQRTIANQSLNGRLQRDLIRFLRVSSGEIGYLHNASQSVTAGQGVARLTADESPHQAA